MACTGNKQKQTKEMKMKKLMVILAAMAIGFAAQAGTVSWSMTNVYLGNTTDKAEGCIAYLLVGDDLTAPISAITSTDTAKAFIAANNTYGGSAIGDSTGKFAVTAYGSYAAGDVTVYAVVFNAATIEDATQYYVSKAAKDLSIPGSGDGSVTIGTQKTNSQVAANWHAIPEPTSGLLMLVGLGALALRRRRA